MTIMCRTLARFVVALAMLLGLGTVVHAIDVEPAPAGDATSVATSVIKANFDSCKRVTKATRQKDGTIFAKCSGAEYLVFTLKNPKTAATQSVALNCEAAKTRLGVSCRR
jgi:hypothetical protein